MIDPDVHIVSSPWDLCHKVVSSPKDLAQGKLSAPPSYPIAPSLPSSLGSPSRMIYLEQYNLPLENSLEIQNITYLSWNCSCRFAPQKDYNRSFETQLQKAHIFFKICISQKLVRNWFMTQKDAVWFYQQYKLLKTAKMFNKDLVKYL